MADQLMKLPDVSSAPAEMPASGSEASIPSTAMQDGLSTKEIIFTGGSLLAAAILLLIVKGAVSKALVANMKKSPRAADMAAWSLFGFLMFAAFGAALGILNPSRYLTVPYLAPITVAMLVLIVLFVVALGSRR